MSEKLPTHKQLPVEVRGVIPYVLTCLEDRNADVRKRAGDVLVPLMIHTGYDAFLKALGKCKVGHWFFFFFGLFLATAVEWGVQFHRESVVIKRCWFKFCVKV